MADTDYPRKTAAATRHPASKYALTGAAGLLMIAILALLAVSILLFRNSFSQRLDAQLLTLFAVAGSLGGALRSFAYSLASGSFTERERRQWLTESVVAPVIGAVAGMLAYLVVRASLIDDPRALTREGQYLISLIAGALALRPLASVVERGLLRSSMSRSGILGGEISPSVPLLDRIETMLEQRVVESSLSNYDGWVDVTVTHVAPGQWALHVALRSSGADEADLDSKVQSARIVVTGGADTDAALFGIAVISRAFEASPPLLSVSTPRHGRAHGATIFLEAEADENGPTDADPVVPEGAVVLEISQGTKALAAVRVPLDGRWSAKSGSGPSPWGASE